MLSYEATAPSNIAFLKYWGKDEPSLQWPSNDSLSMTLESCVSKTSVRLGVERDRLLLEGVRVNLTDCNQPLGQKIQRLKEMLKVDENLDIKSTNSFPTGCGIASSASGMAALVIATAAAKTGSKNLTELCERGYDAKTLSHVARLLSGSAARSLWGGFVLWRRGDDPSKHYAERIESDWQLCDTVMVVDDKRKDTCSSAGHNLASTSPLYKLRQTELPSRLEDMRQAICDQDIMRLGPLLEQEAINMHAVMLSSRPRLEYLSDESTEAMCWLRGLRIREGIPAYFTVDAGPNIHIIHEPQYRPRLLELIGRDWPHVRTIKDQIGRGPALRLSSVAEANGVHCATI